jgi:hypothetical protein
MKNLVCPPSSDLPASGLPTSGVLIATLFASLSLAASGCNSSTPAGFGGGGANGAGGGGGGNVTGTGGGGGRSGLGGAPSGAGGGGGATGKIPLGSTQCSDGIDNDNDGFIDYADPECVGPLDNDESSFATGIPGDNMDACKQDCFFDGNSGMGDDHCLWQLKCDPLSKEASCPYDPTYAAQHQSECSVASSQSQTCIDFCRKLVPNGCDCFGCCAIPGAPQPIRLAATCTADKFGDPTACPPCTQVTQCANPCEHCEICIGKPTLPADCYQGGADGGTDAGTDASTDSGYQPPPPVCSSGWVACGPGGVDPKLCPTGTGCVTGCCIPIVP